MMTWACAIEDDSPDRAECHEMILDAYYLCELSKNYRYGEEIKKYHNDMFGSSELDWHNVSSSLSGFFFPFRSILTISASTIVLSVKRGHRINGIFIRKDHGSAKIKE